jgi:hypothetical protein
MSSTLADDLVGASPTGFLEAFNHSVDMAPSDFDLTHRFSTPTLPP